MNAKRVEKLAEALADAGLDVFVAQTPTTLSYLTGLAEDAHERFLGFFVSKEGHQALICPALSAEQAARHGIQPIFPWRDGEDPLEQFQEITRAWGLRTAVLAVDDHLPAKMLLQMQDALPAALFKSGGEVLAELMAKKDASELDAMRRAGAIVDQVYAELHTQLRLGMTEKEVEHWLRGRQRELGGNPTFCSVGFGPNGAEPHHTNDDTPLRVGDVVVVDFGCEVEGYNSDITRVFAVGKAAERAHEVYDIVHKAHQAAVAKAAKAVSGAEIDAAAREVITQAGYGEYFTHRTGHGIGMNVHEAPDVASYNHKPFEVGNCFSIEPGIYLPGEFGVRIENLYHITEKGPESFNVDPSPRLEEISLT